MSKKKHKPEGHRPSPATSIPSPDRPSKSSVEGRNGEDVYRPSPILDDLSAHSEGCPPKLDRKFYEKELGRLQVELV
jgi:hypothetical protein